MARTADAAQGGLRDRFRSQVRDEVKQVALRQLADGGPQALSINAIGKELGVSGPALYRYFANRDDLLTELVLDAYQDLATALAAAIRPTRKLTPEQRLRAFAAAYRKWANDLPHRYRLLYVAPWPGYDAQDARLVAASKNAMLVLLDVLAPLMPHGDAESERTPLDDQLERWSSSRELADVPPALGLAAVITWSRLHGLASLEIEGTYTSMGIDAQLLYDNEIAAILTSLNT